MVSIILFQCHLLFNSMINALAIILHFADDWILELVGVAFVLDINDLVVIDGDGGTSTAGSCCVYDGYSVRRLDDY